jgi:hypothetical protein
MDIAARVRPRSSLTGNRPPNGGLSDGSAAPARRAASCSPQRLHREEHVSGLAASFNGKPYPHVQHIHIAAKGQCPDMSADTSGDGVISTTESGPFYGAIGTTLSTSGDTGPAAGTTLTVAPSGASFHYQRSFQLDAVWLSVMGRCW